MDACKTETLGPAALRKNTEESLRPPLSLSEKNNAAPPVARKPRTREVTSRYKSGLTPISIPPPSAHAATQRCPSPTASRVGVSQTPSLPKRSLSADRRRPTTTSRTAAPSSPSKAALSSPSSRPSTPVRDVTADLQASSRRLNSGRSPDGLWPAMRSLSASFQSESSVSNGPTKREKPVPDSTATPDSKLTSSENVTTDRKRTPSRGRSNSDHSENSRSAENSSAKVPDQHRWPGIMNGKFSAKSMSRSMDLTERVSRAGTLPVSARGVSPTRKAHISDAPSRGLQKTTKEVTRRMSLDGSGRLEHEIATISNISVDLSERIPSLTRPSRTMSLPLPGSPHPSSPGKASSTSAFSSRSMASPSRMRPSNPSSPSKLSMASASFPRGTASPSRTRPSTPVSPICIAGRTGTSSSVFSCILDVRKGRKNTNHLEDPHQLRLLYNQYLQWRFVNARADAAMFIQKTTIEKILYCVWGATSKMRTSVTMKRIKMQQLRQELKLASVLKHQMTQLEDWASLEREHLGSLLGAIEALKASTIRLPVIRGAGADIHSLKDAISSAVDVMQAMGSSICHLISMVEGTSSLVSELSEVAVKENDMLTECRELLASTAAAQVQESSLRTYLLQLRQDTI
ncbi:hypothetical protein Taro_009714 [Colocasia esculenta]|uniref:AUGMIN subunit 8 n=1 Tax=Colocasia esculenta TaxID=4460 RepID=A0A843UAT1_COLES|nr:hypothetical protein [Colocasia esculenta]